MSQGIGRGRMFVACFGIIGIFALGLMSSGTASAAPTVHAASTSTLSVTRLYYGTWWKLHCKPHVSHKPVKSRRITPRQRSQVTAEMWLKRRRDERLFLRCAYGYSRRLAYKAVRSLKQRIIPTVQQYRTYSIGAPGEQLPKPPGKPYHPCSTSCAAPPQAHQYAPMTDTPHNGNDCQRTYDHNASAWWNEELYSCLHYNSVQVSNGPSYFVTASVTETVFKSFWGAGDADDGDLNSDNNAPDAAHYPYMTHGDTYGDYPWVEAHTIRVFSTGIHVSTHGAGFTLVPTWYVCGNPRVYANGYETNDGTACYVH